MRLVNLLGADSVQHPEHGTAEAGPDGVFDVTDHFGTALLEHRGQWRTEAEHVAAQARDALAELVDPHQAAKVLHDLRARVVELEAKLAGHEAPADPPTDPPADDTGKGKAKS